MLECQECWNARMPVASGPSARACTPARGDLDPRSNGRMDEWRVQGLRETLQDGSADQGFHFKRLDDLGPVATKLKTCWVKMGSIAKLSGEKPRACAAVLR